MISDEVIFSIRNVTKAFKVGPNKFVKAVNGVSLDIHKGETVGLVGESGCGKSTLGNMIVRMFEPTSGEILFHDMQTKRFNHRQRIDFCKRVQMIFQDPYASLDPRMTVGSIIEEGLAIHNISDAAGRQKTIRELLTTVGLEPEFGNRFPHEFSGGQRQRIGIARALAVEPEFIVCDEPISALDVSIQAQTVNLLKNLQNSRDLTYLFIAHDLNMVKYISDRVAVMYLGSLVELSASADIYDDPLHPYTKALLSAVPVADPVIEQNKPRFTLTGDVPSPINMKPGCPFCSRCTQAMSCCADIKPELIEIKPGHFAACHLYDQEVSA